MNPTIPPRRLESIASSIIRMTANALSALGSPCIFKPLIFALAAVGLSTVILQIPRTLGTHDEAWYLMVIRDHVSENGGAWNMLLGFLPDSLVMWRALSLAIRIIACPLICYGILAVTGAKPLEKARLWVPLAIGFVLAADCDPVWVAAYYNINYLCFAVSFALATYAGSASGLTSFTAAFWSGIFAFFLFPILPTNFPSCTLIAMAAIYWTGRNRGKRLQKLVLFLAGMATGAAIFFGLCESPSEYLEMARSVGKSAVGGSGGHSIKGFIKWIAQASRFVSFNVVAPAAALALIRWLPRTGRRDIAAVAAVTAVVFGLTAGSMLSQLGVFFIRVFPALPPEFPWIAACFLVMAVPSRNKTSDAVALLLVLAIPVALSFGSAVPLTTRGRAYMWPFAIAALLRAEPLLSLNPRRLARGAMALIVALSFVCSLGQHFGTWIIAEKNYFRPLVADAATCLRIPPGVKSTLERARAVGVSNTTIQPLNRYCWGYVYALEGKVLSRTFESEYVNWEKRISLADRDTVYLIATTAEEKAVERRASNEHGISIEKVMAFSDEWNSGTIYKATKSQSSGNGHD